MINQRSLPSFILLPAIYIIISLITRVFVKSLLSRLVRTQTSTGIIRNSHLGDDYGPFNIIPGLFIPPLAINSLLCVSIPEIFWQDDGLWIKRVWLTNPITMQADPIPNDKGYVYVVTFSD